MTLSFNKNLFDPEYDKNYEEYSKKSEDHFNSLKKLDPDMSVEEYIKIGATHSKYIKDDADNINISRIYKELKIKDLIDMGDRFTVGMYSDPETSRKSVITHEFHHAIDLTYGKQFSDMLYDKILKSVNNDYKEYVKLVSQISYYAFTNPRELFAEVGSAISIGEPVPKKIRDAYDATMKTHFDKQKMERESKNKAEIRSSKIRDILNAPFSHPSHEIIGATDLDINRLQGRHQNSRPIINLINASKIIPETGGNIFVKNKEGDIIGSIPFRYEESPAYNGTGTRKLVKGYFTFDVENRTVDKYKELLESLRDTIRKYPTTQIMLEIGPSEFEAIFGGHNMGEQHKYGDINRKLGLTISQPDKSGVRTIMGDTKFVMEE